MHAIPSPNIWSDPDVYELENLAIDPDGEIEDALRSITDWAGLDVVDIGCGTGFHLPAFAATARSVVGVEPHPPLVERARARVADLGHVQVVESGAQELPLAAGSVDVHHSRWAYFFGPGCEPGLAELDRVIRPGGTSFVIDHDGVGSPFGKLYRSGWAVLDPAEVDRFWTGRGWTKQSVEFRWVFPDRATVEAVVRLEFGPVVAREVLGSWSGLELQDRVNLWWRRY
ncbi:class I SAM-dependent methyltransferase [Lentzea sp. NPDC060358]|uniref:class I SAM-dependent methyltransferase n=1 Tax=Lentzea sp. NPDC060358 TaxID=3347103 RepID=UPI00364E1C0F